MEVSGPGVTTTGCIGSRYGHFHCGMAAGVDWTVRALNNAISVSQEASDVQGEIVVNKEAKSYCFFSNLKSWQRCSTRAPRRAEPRDARDARDVAREGERWKEKTPPVHVQVYTCTCKRAPVVFSPFGYMRPVQCARLNAPRLNAPDSTRSRYKCRTEKTLHRKPVHRCPFHPVFSNKRP